MNKKILSLVIIVIIVIFGSFLFFTKKGPPEKSAPEIYVDINPGSVVTNPLEVDGEALGKWYFEASFPVKIYDANGKLLGSVPAQAQSDWETENFVPFKASLNFTTSTTASGTLILEKDNPSGRPESASQYEVPVRFENQ